MHIVFGGSFNPPTKAHVHIIKHLLSTFPSSKVIVVPVGDDYSKKELVRFSFRMEMLKLALQDIDQVILSDIEAKRKYQGTLKTLNDLSITYEDICFVIGSDNLEELEKWIKYKELLFKYPVIIMNRNGYMTEEEANKRFKDVNHRFIFIEFSDSSASTNVRKNVHDYKHLLDPKVYQFILAHHIYEVKKNV